MNPDQAALSDLGPTMATEVQARADSISGKILLLNERQSVQVACKVWKLIKIFLRNCAGFF